MMPTFDYPYIDGRAVTERHARICRESGHAPHIINGRDTGQCARCGHVEPRATTVQVFQPEPCDTCNANALVASLTDADARHALTTAPASAIGSPLHQALTMRLAGASAPPCATHDAPTAWSDSWLHPSERKHAPQQTRD